MEEISNNFSFVYIDKNPKMKLIGFMDIINDNPTDAIFVEEVTGLPKVA